MGSALVATNASAALSVDVLSSRPDLVSNASALVAIKGAAGTPNVTWDNRDITNKFFPDPNVPNQWVGLVVTSPQTSHLNSCNVVMLSVP